MDHVEVGDTKERLMEAAGRIFSEKGFKAATVREICRLANANVAAVHYHFGDKEGLYKSLLTEAFEIGLKRYPPSLGLGPEAPAEERLHAFVHSFLSRLMGGGRFAWCGKLMARESEEPTPALDHMVERYILPLSVLLRQIVAEILNDGTRPEDARAFNCAMSVVGQCQHIFRNRAVIDKLSPSLKTDEAGIAALARHITDFSLSALKHLPRHDSAQA
ncbi:MAG: CerR family C-terminal domain-containing protein [Humidesulfovibrio sp.]|nr:CerR family C-terminal domain-containing protein [Humidesulfovibrio sp.]